MDMMLVQEVNSVKFEIKKCEKALFYAKFSDFVLASLAMSALIGRSR
jgi:hypothetical protein